MLETKEKIQVFTEETFQGAKSFAVKAGESVKDKAKKLDQALSESKLERDRKNLRPIFPDDLRSLSHTKQSFLTATNDSPYNMIRIVERDKKREANRVSKGAIGYWTSAKGLDVLNLYEDITHDLEVSFYPLVDKSVFYIHPYFDHLYINLDDYFEYLKKARVTELEMIASELGAKRVVITFKEYSSNELARKMSSKANAKDKRIPKKNEDGSVKANDSIGASASYESKGTDVMNMEIAANLTFTGHDTPRVPELVYFKGENDIEQLIKLRTDPHKKNTLLAKTYSLQYNKSSGIKESTAAQIDAALNSMNCSVNISSEAQRETRTILEYHIEF